MDTLESFSKDELLILKVDQEERLIQLAAPDSEQRLCSVFDRAESFFEVVGEKRAVEQMRWVKNDIRLREKYYVDKLKMGTQRLLEEINIVLKKLEKPPTLEAIQ